MPRNKVGRRLQFQLKGYRAALAAACRPGLMLCVSCLFFAAGLAWPLEADGHTLDVPDIAQRLALSDLWWQENHHFSAAGVPLHAREFTTRHEPAALAQAWADTATVFQRMLVLPGRLILSGLEGAWHWLASLEPTEVGTRGTVSVLFAHDSNAHLPEHVVGPADAVQGQIHQWLSAVGDRVLDSTIHEHSRDVALAAYRSDWSPAQLRDYLAARLQAQSWVPMRTAQLTDSAWSWKRGSSQLVIVVAAEGPGSVVFVQHLRDLAKGVAR